MYAELSRIDSLRVIPSQANYFMVDLCNGLTAKELNRRMITGHNILVKDLVAKMDADGRQYLRFAIRNHYDNLRLIKALIEELKES